MIPVLLRAGARYHVQHPWQLALALLGVTLGVAVVVAVDVATGSARRAFDLSTEAVSGRATHEIVGGPNGIADSTYVRLRTSPSIDAMIAPVMDRFVRLPDHDRRVLRLLGVDPFAEPPFRTFTGAASATGAASSTASSTGAADASDAAGAGSVARMLTQRALFIARATATDLGLGIGDTVRVEFGATSSSATIGGVLDVHDALSRRALRDVAIADIATVQELTGSTGTIDRIDVRVGMEDSDTRSGASNIDPLRSNASGDEASRSTASEDVAASLAMLAAALPPGLRLLETDARAGATAQLTRAFDTNLTALALVALVFGMFLIYNSVSFSVVQRRPLLGLLRAQGVTARELFAQILVEAAVLGAAATVLGLAAGTLLGSQLVRLVSRTINDLYFAVTVTSFHIEALTFGKAALLGLGGTVLAAVPPALEALRTPPRATLARAALERRAVRAAPRLAIAGAICALLAAVLLLIPSQSITMGFAALFVLVLAAALITPATTILLMRLVRPGAAWFGAIGRMAPRGVTGSLSRTAPAIAALGVALAVGIAVTLMIGSFRGGVIRWLEQSLQADIYIAVPGPGANRTDVTLDPRIAGAIADVPGVAGMSTYRHVSLLLTRDLVRRGLSASTAESDLVRMIGFDPSDLHRGAFELLDVSARTAWAAFDHGAILVSEPLAYRHHLTAGDSITLPTDRGPADFAIAGTFRDYSSEHGVIFMPRASYDAWWDDRSLTAIAVFINAGADVDTVIDRIRSLPSAQGTLIRANRGLRDATLQVFDRTFMITGVLRLLALIVAFVGVTGALMALQLERAREIGVLRATGLTPVQVWLLITSQTALMGLSAAVLGVPLGVAMSWAMVHVINRRSFGWSFDLLFTAGPFLNALAIGIGAALLAGVYPALRMARMRPAQALRDE